MQFNAASFALRLVFAIALVLLTYNPTRYSYLHWLRANLAQGTVGAYQAFTGVALLIAWIIFARATFRSLGWMGMFLAAALLGTLVWLLVALGWIRADSASLISWISLFSLSVLLAVGISWSHIRRRLTGQVDIDDVDSG